MRIGKALERLSAECRDMPRHGWDERLREFCERLLLQVARLEPARVPLRGTRNDARGTRRRY